MSTIASGAATPVRTRERTSFSSALTSTIPLLEEPDRRVQRRPIRREVGEPRFHLADRMRLVEAEDLPRRVGPVAEPVPDLALLVLLAAEQHVAVTVGTGDQRDRGLGLGKAGQVVEVAVVADTDSSESRLRATSGAVGTTARPPPPFSRIVRRTAAAALAMDLVDVLHRGRRRRDAAIAGPDYRSGALRADAALPSTDVRLTRTALRAASALRAAKQALRGRVLAMRDGISGGRARQRSRKRSAIGCTRSRRSWQRGTVL